MPMLIARLISAVDSAATARGPIPPIPTHSYRTCPVVRTPHGCRATSDMPRFQEPYEFARDIERRKPIQCGDSSRNSRAEPFVRVSVTYARWIVDRLRHTAVGRPDCILVESTGLLVELAAPAGDFRVVSSDWPADPIPRRSGTPAPTPSVRSGFGGRWPGRAHARPPSPRPNRDAVVKVVGPSSDTRGDTGSENGPHRSAPPKRPAPLRRTQPPVPFPFASTNTKRAGPDTVRLCRGSSASVRENTLSSYRVATNEHLIPGPGQHRVDKLEPEHLER